MPERIITQKFFCCLSLRTGSFIILSLIALRLILGAIEHSVLLLNEWDRPFVSVRTEDVFDYNNKTLGLSVIYERTVQSIYFEKIIEYLFYLIPVVVGFIAVRKEIPLWLTPVTVILICDSLIGIIFGLFSFITGIHWAALIGPFISAVIFEPYFAVVLYSYINMIRNSKEFSEPRSYMLDRS